jgi:siroheme synthase (precorrin-2 oxidase/ferrochelatase)
LNARFHELCPVDSQKYDDIRKFFEKIIKRRRRVERHTEKEPGEKGEDGEEQEEEEEEE